MAQPEPTKPFDMPLGETSFKEALAAMRDPALLASQVQQERQWRALRVLPDGGTAHWRVLTFEKGLIRRMGKLGVPMHAHNMIRTDEEQNRLFADGVSFSRAGESPHNFGLAVDIIHTGKGWNLSEKQWLLIGQVGRELAKSAGLKMRWGGDWDGDLDIHDQKLFDPAHWEVQNWREYASGFPFLPEGR